MFAMPHRQIRHALTSVTALLLGCVALLPGCSSTSAASSGSNPPPWHYTVRVSDDLSTLHVSVLFDEDPGTHFILGETSKESFVSDVTAQPGELPLDRDREHGGWHWGFEERLTGLDYVVHLDQMFARSGRSRDRADRRDVVVPNGAWLVRPMRLPGPRPADLAVDRAESASTGGGPPLEVSFPCGRFDERANGTSARYTLDRTAFWYEGALAIGPFAKSAFMHGDTTFEMVLLNGRRKATPAGLQSWLTRSADAVAALYGGFPKKQVRVLVRPSGRGHEPIVFGLAQRGGGASLTLYLNSAASDSDLTSDWVTVHEMTHLGMPPMHDDDGWMSEGWVTYYTEVLRARAGMKSEEGAWQGIAEGLANGIAEANAVSLRQASRTLDEGQRWLYVYWGGAATALLLDVEMRRQSGGARSLDHAMREIYEWRKARDELVTSDEIIEHLDDWWGADLFSKTLKLLVDGSDFPKVGPAFARLGIARMGDGVQLDDTAPDAAIRRAIMAPPPSSTKP